MSNVPVAAMQVAAIEYFVGDASISAVVVDEHAQACLFPLCGVAEAMREAHQLLGALEGPSTPRERARLLDAFCRGWGRKLLPPWEAIAKFDVLVLIPHHTLHALPLHAIWIEAENAPLAACRAVTCCSSATLFRRAVERNRARTADCAAWIPGDGERAPTGAPPAPGYCAGIAIDAWDGKDEAYRKLGMGFGAHFAEQKGPEMTRLGVKRPFRVDGPKPRTYDAIYFVCHGYYDAVRPVNSGLLVSALLPGVSERAIGLPHGRYAFFRDLPFRELPTEIVPREDALAEMMTIAELRVEGFTEAEVVALLGCSTGAGHVLSGDTMQSMGYQWLKLGAASVIASLWRLDLDFIAGWTDAFLMRWIDWRQPKAIASRDALREILARAGAPPAYQWAAVQLLGDWL